MTCAHDHEHISGQLHGGPLDGLAVSLCTSCLLEGLRVMLRIKYGEVYYTYISDCQWDVHVEQLRLDYRPGSGVTARIAE